jgi:glycerol uptake facilitator-like aquaporin
MMIKAGNPEILSEFLGSTFLTMAAVSPMILFPEILESSISIAVLVNGLVVAFILYVLIEMFGPISGAHFNPIVTIAMTQLNGFNRREAVLYIISQFLGGFVGVVLSHLMYFHELPVLLSISQIQRSGGNYLGEIVGTYVLVLAILVLSKHRSPNLSLGIGLLVGSQLMATSSTMFSNPMITFARILTYSVAGIRPIDATVFIAMQMIGMVLALKTYGLLVVGIETR